MPQLTRQWFDALASVPVTVEPVCASAAVDAPVLRLRGRIQGPALEDLGRWLDQALAASTPRVAVDLRGVLEMSLLAEAMVLNTAARLATQHRQMVLLNPSPALRGKSRLRLFDRLRTDLTG